MSELSSNGEKGFIEEISNVDFQERLDERRMTACDWHEEHFVCHPHRFGKAATISSSCTIVQASYVSEK